jgi:ribosomal protein S18 acetylase RimI-like enzyme
VASIRQLQQQWADEGLTLGFLPESEQQIRGGVERGSLLVAELDDHVVGFICGSVRTSDGMAVAAEGTAYLELEDLYVAPAYRRNRVGSQLVERLVDEARRAGIGKVLVYSASKDMAGVLAFYTRHGFETWYVQLHKDL